MKRCKFAAVSIPHIRTGAGIIAAVVALSLTMLPTLGNAQTSLPEITVSPAPQPPKIKEQLDKKDGGEGKSEARGKGDGDHSLDRLNQQLKRKVDETNPVVNTPPLDARSSDPKIGVINIPGVQQQYGKNFGVSVHPYRPAQVFTPPLGGRH